MINKIIHINYPQQHDNIIDSFIKNNIKYITCNKAIRDLIVVIDVENEERKEDAVNEIIDLILIILKDKYLKNYIWTNYKKLNNQEKQEIYTEANLLLNKKEPFIINTIYKKVIDFIEQERTLNIDGFFRFRMKDFMIYISIISDIAFEEYLIKRDRNQFITTLKYFINSQENRIDLLIIHIMEDGSFKFYDKNSNEIKHKQEEQMMQILMKKDIDYEDCLIGILLALCPQKIQIKDNLKNENSKEIIQNMKIIFEENVKILDKNY